MIGKCLSMGFSDGSLGILNIETGKILFARFSTSSSSSSSLSSSSLSIAASSSSSSSSTIHSSSSLISCVWKNYIVPHENDNYNNHEQSINSSNSINYNYKTISDSGGITGDGSSSSRSNSSSSSSSSRWTSDVWLRDGFQQIQRGGMIPYNDPISSVSSNNKNINGINSVSGGVGGSSSSSSGNMSGSVVNGIGIVGGNLLNLSSSSSNDNHTLYECSNLLHLSLSSNGHVYGHVMGLFPLFHIQLFNHNQQHIYHHHYHRHDNYDDFHRKIESNDNNDDGSGSSKTTSKNETTTKFTRSNNTISTTSTTFSKIDACIVLNKLIVTSCYHNDHNGDEHVDDDGIDNERYIYSIITLSKDAWMKKKIDDLSDDSIQKSSSSSISSSSSSSNVIVMNDNDNNHNKLYINITYNEIYWLQQISILQSIIYYNINLISDYILLCHKKWKECCKVILPKLSLLQNLLNTYEIHCTSIEFLYMITLCGNNWHPCISIIFNQHWNEQSILRLNHNIELSSRSIIKMIHMKVIPLAMNTLLASR